MKKPNYPETPMRNCMYCTFYNSTSNSCTSPRADKIANFNPITDVDCWIFKYNKTEAPETNNPAFVDTYCKGTNCPLYYEKLNICTRPSQCPFPKNEENSTFKNIKFNKEF